MNDKKDASPQATGDQSEHRARMRTDWPNLIDDLIEAGRQKGVFDNLPGQGKPLDLTQNAYASEQALANKLLQENDLKPAWIMQRDDIREQVATLRQEIGLSWQRHERAYRLAGSQIQVDALIISWDDACLAWEARITAINRQIDTFNLKRPSERLELFKIQMAEELAKVGARRYLQS